MITVGFQLDSKLQVMRQYITFKEKLEKTIFLSKESLDIRKRFYTTKPLSSVANYLFEKVVAFLIGFRP